MAIALLLPLGIIAACSSGTTGSRPVQYDTVTTMSGLRYFDYVKGTGEPIAPGMMLKVNYAGYLPNGTLFDTSIDSVGRLYNRQGVPFSEVGPGADRSIYFNRGGYPFQPLDVAIGQGRVIRGWDEGLTTNMRVGGYRRLFIPAALGYGAQGSGVIPPNSPLIFDVQVISGTTPPSPVTPSEGRR
jgi:hypothetical protein